MAATPAHANVQATTAPATFGELVEGLATMPVADERTDQWHLFDRYDDGWMM